MRAYYLAPGPETQDTLGWTLLKKGDAAMSLKLLEQAAAAKPSPAIMYHYASALQANGRNRDALAAIDESLGKKDEFDERPDAEKLRTALTQ
jgi:tetratricopeptide (TPR) repeat protein